MEHFLLLIHMYYLHHEVSNVDLITVCCSLRSRQEHELRRQPTETTVVVVVVQKALLTGDHCSGSSMSLLPLLPLLGDHLQGHSTHSYHGIYRGCDSAHHHPDDDSRLYYLRTSTCVSHLPLLNLLAHVLLLLAAILLRFFGGRVPNDNVAFFHLSESCLSPQDSAERERRVSFAVRRVPIVKLVRATPSPFLARCVRVRVCVLSSAPFPLPRIGAGVVAKQLAAAF